MAAVLERKNERTLLEVGTFFIELTPSFLAESQKGPSFLPSSSRAVKTNEAAKKLEEKGRNKRKKKEL